MVLIDEKGRLFGVVNIVDLIVIILACMLFVVLVRFFYNSKEDLQIFPLRNIQIEIKLYDQHEWTANAISVGDKEIINNKTTAIITNISVMKSNNSQAYDFKDITINLALIAEERNDKYFYNGQQIKIGRNLNVLLDKIDIAGVITKIE